MIASENRQESQVSLNNCLKFLIFMLLMCFVVKKTADASPFLKPVWH